MNFGFLVIFLSFYFCLRYPNTLLHFHIKLLMKLINILVTSYNILYLFDSKNDFFHSLEKDSHGAGLRPAPCSRCTGRVWYKVCQGHVQGVPGSGTRCARVWYKVWQGLVQGGETIRGLSTLLTDSHTHRRKVLKLDIWWRK